VINQGVQLAKLHINSSTKAAFLLAQIDSMNQAYSAMIARTLAVLVLGEQIQTASPV